MRFSCLKEKDRDGNNVSSGSIDVHFHYTHSYYQNRKVYTLPDQFTLEYWFKGKFNPDSTTNFNLFDVELYESSNSADMYNSDDIPDEVETTIQDSIYSAYTINEDTGQEVLSYSSIKSGGPGSDYFPDNSTGSNGIKYVNQRKSYIGISYEYDSTERDCFYVFRIGNGTNAQTKKVSKYLIDNKWCHIALVWDNRSNGGNGTSVIWYLNGQILFGLNMNSDIVTSFKNKNFCRFLWTLHQGDVLPSGLYPHYTWLYNISITQNTDYAAGYVLKDTYYGVRYNKNFVPQDLLFKKNSNYYYGLAVDNDECMCPIIIPEMAHEKINSEGRYNQRVYLPMNSDAQENLGTYGYTYSYATESIPASVLPCDNMSHYFFDYDYAYNLEYTAEFPDTTEIKKKAVLIPDNADDFSTTGFPNGFTIDFFCEISTTVQAADVFPFYNIFFTSNDIASVSSDYLPFQFDTLKKDARSNKRNITFTNNTTDGFDHYTYGISGKNDSTNATKGTFKAFYYGSYVTDDSGISSVYPFGEFRILDSVYREVSKSTYSQIISDSIDDTPSNKATRLFNLNYKQGVYHIALVITPDGMVYYYVNGHFVDPYIINFKFTPERSHKLLISGTNVIRRLAHFRITDSPLWGPENFDPTTDTRIFIPNRDEDRNGEDLILENYTDKVFTTARCALFYPESNPSSPSSPYSRNYSSGLGIWEDSADQKANFQVEDFSASPDKLTLDKNITRQGNNKPINLADKPAVCSATYQDYKNIIKFRNHHIEDVKKWLVIVWVYCKKNKETNFEEHELFYVSGFGQDGRIVDDWTNATNPDYTIKYAFNNNYGNGNGFIGINIQSNGSLTIVTNNNSNTKNKTMFPWSTSFYTMRNYGFMKHRIGNAFFNIDDWNQIAISSDTESSKVYVHFNGERVYTEPIRFSYLHRLFLYTGASDFPIKPYFAGLKVLMGTFGRYGNVNEIVTDWKSC